MGILAFVTIFKLPHINQTLLFFFYYMTYIFNFIEMRSQNARSETQSICPVTRTINEMYHHISVLHQSLDPPSGVPEHLDPQGIPGTCPGVTQLKTLPTAGPSPFPSTYSTKRGSWRSWFTNMHLKTLLTPAAHLHQGTALYDHPFPADFINWLALN